MDYQIKEVQSWIQQLKGHRNFFFTNHGIKQFWYLLKQYPDFNEYLDLLLEDIKAVDVVNRAFSTNSYVSTIHEFLVNNESPEIYYSLCAAVLKHIAELSPPIGTGIYTPTLEAIDSCDGAAGFMKAKNFFIETYVSPLASFLIRKRLLADHRVTLFKRYRTLCCTYDRAQLVGKDELELTDGHLSRFLFEEGIDLVLTETNVTSGRIDVFSENRKIVVEGKIYRGNNLPDQYRAISQARARLVDLHMDSAYVVVYNTSQKEVSIQEADGYTDGEPYWFIDGKKLYLIVIDLDDELNKPKEAWPATVQTVAMAKSAYISWDLTV